MFFWTVIMKVKMFFLQFVKQKKINKARQLKHNVYEKKNQEKLAGGWILIDLSAL